MQKLDARRAGEIVIFRVENERTDVGDGALQRHRIVRPPLALIVFVKLNEVDVVSLQPL